MDVFGRGSLGEEMELDKRSEAAIIREGTGFFASGFYEIEGKRMDPRIQIQPPPGVVPNRKVTPYGLRQESGFLDLSGKGLSPSLLQEIEDKGQIRGMKLCRLDLRGPEIPLLRWFPSLESLDFLETPLASLDLSSLWDLPKLSDLALGMTGLQDQDLWTLLPGLPKLQRLHLGGTRLTDAAASVVAAMPALERLHLGRTAITDKGLASVASSSSLRFLNLEGTAITDRGLRSLGRLQTLRTCALRHTPITKAGVESLQRALPTCVILWG